VLIRTAKRGDVAAVTRLLGQLGYPADEEPVARRLKRLQRSAADELFVAEADGEVVGLAGIHVSASLEYDEDAAKVSAIVVDEAHRLGGVGRALLEAVEGEARRRGCALVFLTTAERRKDAHEFYRRLGWEETGRRFAKRLR
jgi:N-acetylglutamate synthase-like GNAT family acetyltransferase